VKFLFATTEVNKVPVTVLSRCQRFDLKRIPAEKLIAHFGAVAKAEGVEVEPDALAMIVRAAEGSARDGLSILDQAIAHGAGAVTADQVRDMLGLADRGRLRDLLDLVLQGDTLASLAALDEAHALGVDPASLVRGLMEALHSASRAKAGASGDVLQSAEQRDFAEKLAAKLSWAQIHRLWQMLLKGLADVSTAPDPQEAATMAILRLIHSADLPDPAAILDRLSSGAAMAPQQLQSSGSPAGVPAAQAPADFRSLVQLLDTSGKAILAQQLHDQVGIVRYAPPELVLRPQRPLGSEWARELAVVLKSVTGSQWKVTTSDEPCEPSLLEQEKMAEQRVRSEVLEDEGVRAVFDAFPEAELESYSTTKGA
jgi:DNA polymerase-3 subunit gamma/tau